jgi:hypothetical protein
MFRDLPWHVAYPNLDPEDLIEWSRGANIANVCPY